VPTGKLFTLLKKIVLAEATWWVIGFSVVYLIVTLLNN
jgi:hypothetical protein